MSLSVRVLDSADNAMLILLGNAVDTAGGGFEVDRTPDFFAFARSVGDPTYFGAFVGGTLVGSIGVTRQKRFVAGTERLVDYVHDLRIARSHRGPVVLRRLLESVRTCCERRNGWAFGTILDSNDDGASLKRGGRIFGGVRILGRTIHAGFPLSDAIRGSGSSVSHIDALDAWRTYERLASARSLAPADSTRFEANDGFFLGVERSSRLVAVAKLVDQARLRRIYLNGGELRIVYLAYFVEESGSCSLEALLDYVRDVARERFSLVFVGLSESELSALRAPPVVRLSSVTVGFGNVPPDVELGFHELTLI